MKALALIISTLCAAFPAGAGAAVAAGDYPLKPVRLVVPFAAGGGTDVTARLMAQKLSVALGQAFVVDNRGGAGGVIGADLVAKSTPDGYTLVLGSPGPLTINPTLQAKMPYELRDFSPISLMTLSPFILVLHPGVPASNVKELIALAKAKPDALNFGTGGNGSVAHFSAEQFKSLAGVRLTHVPYKGSAPSVSDLLGGRLHLVFENLPVVLPHIRAGKLKALAVGSSKRSTLVPEYPTIAEAGVPGYESTTAFGVLAPAKTNRAIVGRLSHEIATAIMAPDLREGLAARGFEPVGSTPEEYAAHLRDELTRYARLVKVANIRLE